MEFESYNKEFMHGSKKKRKRKSEGNIVSEHCSNENNQECDNEGKRKSKKIKRKKSESENHDKTIHDASHAIEKKEIYMDVKISSLDCGGNVKKIKNKEKHIKNKFDERYSDENNQECDNEEKRKRKSIKQKRKKYESENHEKIINDESHEIEKTKEIYMDLKKNSLDCGVNVKKKKCKEKHIKDNFDKRYSDKNNQKINNISSFIQPKVSKNKDKNKKIKKERYMEKVNAKDDCNEKSKDNSMKNKKYKKKKDCKNNGDSSSTSIGIMNEKFEDCIQEEATVVEESNTERIHSLYAYGYTKETNRLNSRDDMSESLNKQSRKKGKLQNIEMYDDFLYKKPVIAENLFGDIEQIPEKDSYWAKQNAKYDVASYPQEEVQKNLLDRIECIVDYFDRFATDDLTEEECQEKELLDFEGPYLPTSQHVQFFADLNIEIDWDIPSEQELLFSFNSLKDVVKSGEPFIRYPFLRSEDEILLDNWKKFQEQYKFYDLRPLVGFRTMKVIREGRLYKFEPVSYIDPTEKYKFLLHMAKGLEKRTKFQVLRRIIQIAMRIHDDEISYESRLFEPREVAEIEAFIKLFGTDYKGMEFFLGRVNYMRYSVFSKIHIKYKNMPIRVGHWQSTEKSRLVRSIFRATNASSIKELLNSRVAWQEVFPMMQTRLQFHCQSYFKNHLKRRLELASNLANQESDSAHIYWTSNDVIKLLMLVSENLGPTVSLIDWAKISSHFKLFGPNCCLYRFRRLYYQKVPRNIRPNLKRGVDYLLKYIVPQLQNGLIMFKKDPYTLDELRSMPLKKDQSVKKIDKWSLENTIKLIKEVYENAGSSLETTNWCEISSHFTKYDETNCRNHFRYLYFNRVLHQHRVSFDSALEYLRNIICPMLEHKTQRNRRESLLTEEVVNLSSEDHLVLQSLINDITEADDDEDIVMLQQEFDKKLEGTNSQSTSIGNHAISVSDRIARMNALTDYIQERHEEEDIDGDLEDIGDHTIDSYLNDLDRNENISIEGEICEKSSLYEELEDTNNEDSDTDEFRSETSDKEKKKAVQINSNEYNYGNVQLFHKKEASQANQLRRTHDLSDSEEET